VADTKVTQPMLADAANKAVTVGEGVAGQLTSLLSTIESQGGASFRGGGGNALQSTSQELGTSLQKLLAALNSMAEAVNVSNVAYGSTDSDVASEISAVASGAADPAIVTALRG
jgi:uncharacterized protein YukE